MNGLDIVICVLIAWGLVRGAMRGLIKEVSSLAGVFVGFYAAYTYYPVVAPEVDRYLGKPAMANIIAFFSVFVLVFLAVAMVGVIVKYLLKVAHLGWVDKITGSVFGVIKCLLICAIIVYALTFFLPAGKALILEGSLLAPHVTSASETLREYVPDDFKKGFGEKVTALKQNWADKNTEGSEQQ